MCRALLRSQPLRRRVPEDEPDRQRLSEDGQAHSMGEDRPANRFLRRGSFALAEPLTVVGPVEKSPVQAGARLGGG